MKLRVLFSVWIFVLLELTYGRPKIASNDPFKNMFATTTPKPSRIQPTNVDDKADIFPKVRICPGQLVYLQTLKQCVKVNNG
jgi:hypothetical protein